VYDFERLVEALIGDPGRFRVPPAGAVGLHRVLIWEHEHTDCTDISRILAMHLVAHLPHDVLLWRLDFSLS